MLVPVGKLPPLLRMTLKLELCPSWDGDGGREGGRDAAEEPEAESRSSQCCISQIPGLLQEVLICGLGLDQLSTARLEFPCAWQAGRNRSQNRAGQQRLLMGAVGEDERFTHHFLQVWGGGNILCLLSRECTNCAFALKKQEPNPAPPPGFIPWSPRLSRVKISEGWTSDP